MRNILRLLLVITLLASFEGSYTSAYAAQPQKKAMTAQQKQKAKEKAKKEKEREKAKAQKAKEAEKRKREQERAQQQRSKEQTKTQAARAKEQAEREKAAAERERVAAQKEADRQRIAEQKAAAEQRELEALRAPKPVVDPNEKKIEPVHYFNLGARLGYDAMFDNLSTFGAGTQAGADPLARMMNKKLIGGVGAGLQLTYELEYSHFRFETGLGFDFYNSTTTYGFTQHRTYTSADKSIRQEYWFLSDNISETRNLGYVQLPIMLGAQFSRYYFMVGARIGYGVLANYSHKGQYDIVIEDRDFVTQYGGGIIDAPSKSGKITLAQPSVAACVELGLDLDEWMQQAPARNRNRVKPGERIPFGRQHVHYKVALFADYELLNINKTHGSDNNLMPLTFANNETRPNGTNTLLGLGTGAKLTNLFVGAKFVVQFEVPGKTERPAPTPPAYMEITVVDAETGAVLPATITVLNQRTGKTTGQPMETKEGKLTRKMSRGSYDLMASVVDYYPDTITMQIPEAGQLYEATMHMRRIPVIPPVIEEIPVETGEVFVMHNLHFANNQTRILPSSEEGLNMLFGFLTRNPEVRIRIMGHTDSVGRDAANQRLSEGRANAVRDDLIQRGIAADRIEAIGFGETKPIDTNDTEEGRQNNRRVEIEIL